MGGYPDLHNHLLAEYYALTTRHTPVPKIGRGPHAAVPVFEHCHCVVVRQALLFVVSEETPRRQPNQPFDRANPQVAFLILKERIDPVIRDALALQLIEEPPLPKTIQPTARANPEVAVPVLTYRIHEAVGQAILPVIGIELARVIPDHAIVGANPNTPAFVLRNAPDRSLRQPIGPAESLHARPSQSIQPGRCPNPQISLRVLKHGAD